jgi:hypothetical protein
VSDDHADATEDLRDAGYREGYVAALRWVLREHPTHVDELLHALLCAVIERSSR